MNELVQCLSTGMHKVEIERVKSAQDLKLAIESGYVLVNFMETKGGTELAFKVDYAQTLLGHVDFGIGKGVIHLVGLLVLNYTEVELIADVDLSTVQGRACLKIISDEPIWRVKLAQKEFRSSLVAH